MHRLWAGLAARYQTCKGRFASSGQKLPPMRGPIRTCPLVTD